MSFEGAKKVIKKCVVMNRPMEQRLIDASALIHKVNNSMYPSSVVFTAAINLIHEMINAAPTIDPVVHREWVNVNIGDCCYECSECQFIRDAYLLDNGNFCPNCGAKMDGNSKRV